MKLPTFTMEVTKNEARLLAAIRSLHPFEKVVISADKQGHVDSYIVERSFKELWITYEESSIVSP